MIYVIQIRFKGGSGICYRFDSFENAQTYMQTIPWADVEECSYCIDNVDFI